MSDLHRNTLTELAAGLRARRYSSVELVRAYLEPLCVEGVDAAFRGLTAPLPASEGPEVIFSRLALPALAVFGGVYLFFHKHGGMGMEQMMADPAMASSPAMKTMMDTMDLVKHEHLWFSIIAFGLAAAKLTADTGRLKGRLGATLWTFFAIILGIYMMGYIE